jgi:hypothetical protein
LKDFWLHRRSAFRSFEYKSISPLLHQHPTKMPPKAPPDPKFGNLSLADARLLASIIKNSKVDQTSWDAVNEDIGKKGRAAPERWFALRRRVPLLDGVRIPVRAKLRRENEAGRSGAQSDRQHQEEKDNQGPVDNDDQDLGVADLSLNERKGERKGPESKVEDSDDGDGGEYI